MRRRIDRIIIKREAEVYLTIAMGYFVAAAIVGLATPLPKGAAVFLIVLALVFWWIQLHRIDLEDRESEFEDEASISNQD